MLHFERSVSTGLDDEHQMSYPDTSRDIVSMIVRRKNVSPPSVVSGGPSIVPSVGCFRLRGEPREIERVARDLNQSEAAIGACL